jgi:hypothetical protein
MSRPRSKPTGLPIVNDKAAAIDIGSRFHVVAVPPDLCDEPVQTFQAFTADLERMADWIVSLGIKTVAMESTGVYWIPSYEILESRGIEVIVANCVFRKSVTGVFGIVTGGFGNVTGHFGDVTAGPSLAS